DVRPVRPELLQGLAPGGCLRYELHVGFRANQPADAVTQQSVVVYGKDTNWFLSGGHDYTFFLRNSHTSLRAMPISNPGRNDEFRFRARTRFSQEFQLRPDAFCALADARQSPVTWRAPDARTLRSRPFPLSRIRNRKKLASYASPASMRLACA